MWVLDPLFYTHGEIWSNWPVAEYKCHPLPTTAKLNEVNVSFFEGQTDQGYSVGGLERGKCQKKKSLQENFFSAM